MAPNGGDPNKNGTPRVFFLEKIKRRKEKRSKPHIPFLLKGRQGRRQGWREGGTEGETEVGRKVSCRDEKEGKGEIQRWMKKRK